MKGGERSGDKSGITLNLCVGMYSSQFSQIQ